MRQKGFATLEVILMVVVIAILASIAVPRFQAVTTAANTAKVQADLSSLDTAAAIYVMENDNSKATLSITTDLAPYLQDASNLKPPVGDVYVDAGEGKITIAKEDNYEVKKQTEGDYRATLKTYTAGQFKKKSTT